LKKKRKSEAEKSRTESQYSPEYIISASKTKQESRGWYFKTGLERINTTNQYKSDAGD
jgi:hypothetical protein